MMAFVFLPARACLAYHGTLATLVDETSWFILRGFGMPDAVIAQSLAAARQSQFENPAP
jgi:hypothetical protein